MVPVTSERAYENPAVDRIFGVFLEKQTYKNVGYLLLSFPLGLLYFLLIVPGLSLSLGLSFVVAGLPLLLGMLLLAEKLLLWERYLLRRMLGRSLEFRRTVWQKKGLFARLGERLTRRQTWKGLSYLLLRFAMGIISFALVVTLIPVSLALIAVPLLFAAGVPIEISGIPVEVLDQTWICCSAGAVLALFSAHVINAWTGIWKRVALSLLN